MVEGRAGHEDGKPAFCPTARTNTPSFEICPPAPASPTQRRASWRYRTSLGLSTCLNTFGIPRTLAALPTRHREEAGAKASVFLARGPCAPESRREPRRHGCSCGATSPAPAMPPPGVKRPGLQLAIANDPGAAPSDTSELESKFSQSIYIDDHGVILSGEGGATYKFSKDGMVVDGQGGTSIHLRESDLKSVKVIGYGASATVSKAFYPRINRFVALKRISHLEKQQRSQMLKDLHTLLVLYQKECPGLVSFMGAFMSSEQDISLALEYMDGGSLADLMKRCAEHNGAVGTIPEPILGKITADVLEGLWSMHQKHTVHRDIKPANILVSSLGQAKLSDFGIAKSNENTLAQCITYAGTVTYMSPERINSKPYDSKADVWSLGLTLLECALGRYPYDAGVGPLQLMIHICEDMVPLPKSTDEGGDFSPEFVEFVRRCMEKDPQHRASVSELRDHPWVRRHRGRDADLSKFVARHSNVDEKINDTAWLMVNRLHMFLDMGVKGVDKAAALFTEGADIRINGDAGAGPGNAAARLRQVAELDRRLGGASRRLGNVMTQRLATGSRGKALIMVHATGTIAFRGGQSGSLVRGGEDEGVDFSEVFIIDTSSAAKERGKGYYGCFFTNYVFRMAGSGSGKAGGANKSVGGPMSLGTL